MGAETYARAVRALDVAVAASVDTYDYQGDWIALVGDTSGYGTPQRWGLLVIGYGSCSGCDAWDGSSGVVERMQDLIAAFVAVTWFDSFEEAQAYVLHEDRGGSFYFQNNGWKDFTERVRAANENTREAETPDPLA